MLIFYEDKQLSKLYYTQNPFIGPLRDLQSMIEKTAIINNSEINDHYKILESSIHNWRIVGGDGNCFYRAFIFSYLEGMIFEGNIEFVINEIIQINNNLNPKHSGMDYLKKEVRQNIVKYHTRILFTHLLTILELLKLGKSDNKYSIVAYNFLIKSMNYSREFDYVRLS